MDNPEKNSVEYDLFNAPQFIDFEDFVNSGAEDPEAEALDKYFETHTEGDDFIYPTPQNFGKENISSLEDITPTIHLLNTPTKKYSNGATGESNSSEQRENSVLSKHSTNSIPPNERVQENQDSCFEIGLKDLSTKKSAHIIPIENKENSHRGSSISSLSSTSTTNGEDYDKLDESVEGETRKSHGKSKFYLRDSLVAQLGKLSIDDVESENLKKNATSLKVSKLSDNSMSSSEVLHDIPIPHTMSTTDEELSTSTTALDLSTTTITVDDSAFEYSKNVNGEPSEQILPNSPAIKNHELSVSSSLLFEFDDVSTQTSMIAHNGDGDSYMDSLAQNTSMSSTPSAETSTICGSEENCSRNSSLTPMEGDGGSERSSYHTALDMSFSNRTPQVSHGLSPFYVEVNSISRNVSLIVSKFPVGEQVNWTQSVSTGKNTTEVKVEITNGENETEVEVINSPKGTIGVAADDEIEVEILNASQIEDPADVSASKSFHDEENTDVFSNDIFHIPTSISNSQARQTSVGLGDEILATILSKSPQKLRRVSSLSDLFKKVEPKHCKTPPHYGFIPRVGITIPKTPDRAKAPRMRWTQNQANVLSKTPSAIPLKKFFPKPHASSTVTSSASLTKPLDSAKEVKPKEPRSKYGTYVPLAQAVAQFQKSTPDRFHSHPRIAPIRNTEGDYSGQGELGGQARSRITAPSPLASKTTVKEPTTSTNGRESLEKKSTFQHPTFPLPSKISRKTTIPKPFNLSKPKEKTATSATGTVNKRNVPLKAFESLKEMRGEIATTSNGIISKAPHFASDDRIKERQKKRSETHTNDDKDARKSQGPSNGRKISTPVKIQKPPSDPNIAGSSKPSGIPITTNVKPFSFEERDKQARKRHEEKIKMAYEKETKIKPFHANPLPKFDRIKGVPPKKPADNTAVEPFKLRVEERGTKHIDDFQRRIDEENKKLQELKEFHAQEPVVLTQKPFQPELNAKVTDPLDIQLNSDSRALEREAFDNNLRLKEKLLQEKKRQAEAEMEEKEKEMVSKIRQQAVHRANPFKINKFFVPKASSNPLTEPMSPAFTLLPSQRKAQTSRLPTSSNSRDTRKPNN